MKYKILSLLFCMFFAFFVGQGQDLDCTLKINTTKITSAGDKALFTTLEKALMQLVNGRQWSNIKMASQERIPCNITIDVQEWDPNTSQIKAYISVQLRRPVYNASYNTNVLNVLDRDLSFKYAQNDPIEYSDNAITSNLTATIAFYCYVILGNYFDSFAPRAGDVFFNKAQNIVNQAQALGETGWKGRDRNSRNRYWIAENYTNGNYSSIHEIIYEYYRKGLDMMYQDPATARNNIYNALLKIKPLNEMKNGLPCKQLFLEPKVEELINIFTPAKAEEKQKVVDLLIEIDASNIQKYRKILGGNTQ
ncbi:MAG: DUF4835 family protein [Bacteroidales bacterium]